MPAVKLSLRHKITYAEGLSLVIMIGYVILCTKAPSWYGIRPPVSRLYAHVFDNPLYPSTWEWFVRDGINHIGLLLAYTYLIWFSQSLLIKIAGGVILLDELLEVIDFLIYDNKWDVFHLQIQNGWLIIMLVAAVVITIVFKKKDTNGTT